MPPNINLISRGVDQRWLVVADTVGSYESADAHRSMHAVDQEKPFETRQSRSLDGGATWGESVAMPDGGWQAAGRGVSADEHMLKGRGLRCDEAIEDGSLVLLDCPGDVPFTHPTFAMMLAKTGLSEGCSAKIMNFVFKTRNFTLKSHKNEELCIKITQKRGILYQKRGSVYSK